MHKRVYGCTVLSRSDAPTNLMKLLSDSKGERPFVTRRNVSGEKAFAFVDALITTVLCFMFTHETDSQVFSINEITSCLEIPDEDAGRALMFMYIRGLVVEIDYDDGTAAYQLTQRGLDLAWDVFSLEDRTKCKWRVGLAVDDGTGLLVPILLNPYPPVLFEN